MSVPETQTGFAGKPPPVKQRPCYNGGLPGSIVTAVSNLMSFLDNLESTLKNMETANDRASGRDRGRLQKERSQSRASAPFAEELKKGPFANEFLTHAVRIAHGMRMKVNMNWVGNTLRVEARERRLEFRPTPEGVQAVFLQDGVEQSAELLDLKKASPEKLAQRWLS
jgi:hypothetical protein